MSSSVTSDDPERKKVVRGKEDETTRLLSRLDSVSLVDAAGGTWSIFSLLGAGSRRDDNNTFVTVLLILNYMVGSGILNTPQTFKESGLAATTVLYFIACELVVRSTRATRACTEMVCSRVLLGNRGVTGAL